MKKILNIACLLFVLASCTKDDTALNNDNGTDVTLNQKVTGSSSNDLLSDAIFKSMVIELVYVEGYKPTQSSIDNFVSFIQARTYKPNGITVETRAIESPGNSPYSTEEIRDIEDANRTKYNNGNQIAVWAFFADGVSDKDTDDTVVLGTAYRNTSFVIYEATIHDSSNSQLEPSRTLLETTVITHEFGHILGLTNFGADMVTNHEDTEHEKHCDVESCLMYWSTTSAANLSNLMGNNTAPQLDAQCIADLQANGGR